MYRKHNKPWVTLRTFLEIHWHITWLYILGMSQLCSATFEQLFAFGANFFGSSNFKQLFPFWAISEQLFTRVQTLQYEINVIPCDRQLHCLASHEQRPWVRGFYHVIDNFIVLLAHEQRPWVRGRFISVIFFWFLKKYLWPLFCYL
jgi:hypothetical protein